MTRAPVPSVRFDTEALAHGEGLEIWRETHGQWHTLRGAPPERISADIAIWNIDGLILTRGLTPGLSASREARRARADGFDHYTVMVREVGDLRMETAEGEALVTPGGVGVIDFARPATLATDDGEGLTLAIPRERLDAVLPPFDMHGATPTGVFGGLMRDFLTSLPARLAEADADDAPALADVCARMIAACLAPSRERAAQARAPLEALLVERAVLHMDNHLHDPDWDVEALAATLRLSRATLYRLFEPHGGVARELRRRRLLRAHRLLSEGAPAGVAQTAYACGFRSDTAFSRAFRRAFGYAPAEARHALGLPRTPRLGSIAGDVRTAWIDGLRARQ